MKYIHIYMIIFCLFLVQSCSYNGKDNVSTDNSKTVIIDMNQEIKEKNIQDIASSMTFLRLEEVDDFPIGFIDKIHITNTTIYILDRRRAKSLFIYDRDGKLKKVIDKVGNGPGEFIIPSDFNIQSVTGNIVILDGEQRKLIYYTKQGDFISELKIAKTHVSFFTLLNENDIALDKGNSISDESRNYIRILDKQGKTITELLPIPKYVRELTVSPRNPLQKIKDTVIFLPSLSNEIYQIHNNKIDLRYQIDFGKFWPKKEYLVNEKGKHPLKFAQDLGKNHYVSFLNYLEDNNVLHLNFNYEEKFYSYYYNKYSGKSILFYSNDENIFPLTISAGSFVRALYSEEGHPALMFYNIEWEQ